MKEDVTNQNIIPTDDPLSSDIFRVRAILLPDKIKYNSNSHRMRRKREKERKNRKRGRQSRRKKSRRGTGEKDARGKTRRSADGSNASRIYAIEAIHRRGLSEVGNEREYLADHAVSTEYNITTLSKAHAKRSEEKSRSEHEKQGRSD